jgi:acetyl esterase/lipase
MPLRRTPSARRFSRRKNSRAPARIKPLPRSGDIADPLVVTVAEPDLAGAAAVVLERAPARFALVGTSAGGNLALEVLAAARERARARHVVYPGATQIGRM